MKSISVLGVVCSRGVISGRPAIRYEIKSPESVAGMGRWHLFNHWWRSGPSSIETALRVAARIDNEPGK